MLSFRDIPGVSSHHNPPSPSLPPKPFAPGPRSLGAPEPCSRTKTSRSAERDVLPHNKFQIPTPSSHFPATFPQPNPSQSPSPPPLRLSFSQEQPIDTHPGKAERGGGDADPAGADPEHRPARHDLRPLPLQLRRPRVVAVGREA